MTKTETKLAEYKADFLKLAMEAGALKADGSDYSLKSKRSSPYFFNIGDFNSGSTTLGLASAYAKLIAEQFKDVPNLLFYGIPEKGVGFVGAVSAELKNKYNIESHWFFTRKMPKTYGEATGAAAGTAKPMVLGKVPTAEDNIILLDDVLTTGESKYEAVETIKKLVDNPKIRGLVIGIDRQEVMVGTGGLSAVEEFTKTTGMPVHSIVNATEISQYLRMGTDQDKRGAVRVNNYLRVYGTEEARAAAAEVVIINNRIVKTERGIIPACDVSDIDDYEKLVAQTALIDGIGGYKIGFSLGLRYGLPALVERTRKHTDKPVIYDHQKAATDVPDTGKQFMDVIKEAGVNAVILFPQSGPETERAWIYRALDIGITVIVGGAMTHPAYLESEGGFIADKGALEMYMIAARAGVTNFVVPGTKPDIIRKVKEAVQNEGVKKPAFWVPGMVTQGGEFEVVKAVLGDMWYPIVGRDITSKKDDYRAAALKSVDQLLRIGASK